jgi:hypothetical protein
VYFGAKTISTFWSRVFPVLWASPSIGLSWYTSAHCKPLQRVLVHEDVTRTFTAIDILQCKPSQTSSWLISRREHALIFPSLASKLQRRVHKFAKCLGRCPFNDYEYLLFPIGVSPTSGFRTPSSIVITIVHVIKRILFVEDFTGVVRSSIIEISIIGPCSA